MNSQDIKEYIIINDKIKYVLEELGCHHVVSHDNSRYYSAGFPAMKGYPYGDNTKAITVYSDNLHVESHTRNIKDKYGNSDIISLVCAIKDLYFTSALKWLCEILGIDYYNDESEDIPLSLQWTNMLEDMNSNMDEIEDDIKLKPINENILDTYYRCGNDLFLKDDISLKTQREFEIGLDLESQRITIPIRDELSTLVGVKGRLFTKTQIDNGDKYIYLEKCSKSKILYGLYKTINYIKISNNVIVVESEKSVLRLWDLGIKNSVSIGGHSLSKYQTEMITRLGIDEVILCYDQDVNRMENGKVNKKEYVNEASKFIKEIKVTAMVDLNGDYLLEKESPVDDTEKFNKLFNERKVLQSGRKENDKN